MSSKHDYMMRMKKFYKVVAALGAGVVACSFLPAERLAQGEVPKKQLDTRTLQARAHDVLGAYCVSCHGPEKQKGDIRFDALETIDSVDQQTLFAAAKDKVHFAEMPPKKAKQPSPEERAVLLAWLKEQLTGEAAGKLAEKLRRPEAGNYVNHEDLFSGEYADLPGYTDDRRWLINEHIFEDKITRTLGQDHVRDIDGKRVSVAGDRSRQFLNPAVNLTNPFLLSNKAGVRYYANETLNSGHLLTMLANAREVSANLIVRARRDPRFLPAVKEIMSGEDQNATIFASRKRFLETHIERVLADTFGDQHEALLPKFVRVQVPAPIAEGSLVNKAPFQSAQPGAQELELIFLSMLRNHKPDITDAQLIEALEHEWFNYGHTPRQIATRVTFLGNYMVEFRENLERHKYADRLKLPVYKPLAEDEMQVISEVVKKHRKAGDTYQDVIDKCLTEWRAGFERQRLSQGLPSKEQIDSLVEQVFVLILERVPREYEVQEFRSLVAGYFADLSRVDAIEKLLQTAMLNTDFVYRSEFGMGEADAHGRRMLSSRDASYALAYALTDSSPDPKLAKAAAEGQLNTREDYEREVRRMLARRDSYTIIDTSVDNLTSPSFTKMPIRELRFFREFFGYDKMFGIFKDNKRFGGGYTDLAKCRLISEADMLVEYILESDQDVFNKLLTTEEFYVYHSGDNEQMKADSDRIRKIYEYFKDKGWEDFTVEDLRNHKDFIAETKMRGIDPNRLAGPDLSYNPLDVFRKQMGSFELRLGNGQEAAAPYPTFPSHGPSNGETRYGGQLVPIEVARIYGIDLTNWDYPTTQPAKVGHRKGMLTHPAWLIAFSANTETDPIHKGIWIQEKLLAGTIPDVPITVDAVIPENPEKTMRQRLDDKTNNDYCMRCHVKINPLGIPFEIYDDFGRYRTKERLEYPENLVEKVKDKGEPHEDLRDIYKTLPVQAKGYLEGTGDIMLDGEVDDALDLIDRLAKSERVRQSIIRHAFRYFMGRNETLNDSKTLIDADRAYLESGGSFDEVIVSLLTSDSFIYRKAAQPKAKD